MSFASTSTRSILRSTRTVLSQRSITTAARIAPRTSLIKSFNARQPQQYRMGKSSFRLTIIASIISAAASTAHSAVASLVSASPLKAGDKVPDVEIRINDLEDKVNFSKLPGKNVLVLVPGAFSPTCSSQVPSYIESTADFAAKGVKGIYVVTVNDMFVVKAWKKDILKDLGNDAQSGGLKVDFTADDCGTFAHAAGLVLDAQAIFGGPRLKRGAIVIEDGIVKLVSVEPNPGEITLTHANEVLKTL